MTELHGLGTRDRCPEFVETGRDSAERLGQRVLVLPPSPQRDARFFLDPPELHLEEASERQGAPGGAKPLTLFAEVAEQAEAQGIANGPCKTRRRNIDPVRRAVPG